MGDKHLHIITHDVPYPADYGGVIDIFYKIKSLHQLGVKIYLHCFVYDRLAADELEKYCEEVIYYKRKNDIFHFSFSIPFIVNSRKSSDLIYNLKLDDYPILIEGIHCSYYAIKGQLNNRIVLLRLFNTEFVYYKQLALHEKNWLKKLYYQHESKLLKKYENNLSKQLQIAALSEQDVHLYQQFFNADNIFYLSVFLPYQILATEEGRGCYCLYHGNLSVNENEEAVIWLLQHVFNDVKIPFVIAGKNPSDKLISIAHEHDHTCLVANPTDKELQDMITKAQVNILPSFNNTGVKLKLLNAIFNGRHCLVNTAGVKGSGLNSICHLAEDADDFKTAINYLYNIPFTKIESDQRAIILNDLYSNKKNADKIISIFWPEK